MPGPIETRRPRHRDNIEYYSSNSSNLGNDKIAVLVEEEREPLNTINAKENNHHPYEVDVEDRKEEEQQLQQLLEIENEHEELLLVGEDKHNAQPYSDAKGNGTTNAIGSAPSSFETKTGPAKTSPWPWPSTWKRTQSIESDAKVAATLPDYQVLLETDYNQQIELTMYGYKGSKLRSLLYYFVLVMTAGFMALVFHWNPHWALVVRRRRCPLDEATFMLIVERYKATESSHHDAGIHTVTDAKADKPEPVDEHEVHYVERVHRVQVEDLKDQFMGERKRGVEKLARKEPTTDEEAVKEKWFDRFLKRACLFEKPEMEIEADDKNSMSKSLDTTTTLVADAEDLAMKEEKRDEDLKPHDYFLRFPHFSVHFDEGIFEEMKHLRFFRYKQLRYVWNERTQTFVKLMGLDANIPNKLLQPQYGLTIAEQMARRLVYGLNKVEIPMNTTLQLVYLEFLNPFYVFQIFSCILWFFYNYYYYACVIILMSAFGITLSVIQTKQNQNSLYRTVNQSNLAVDICNVLIVVDEEDEELSPGQSGGHINQATAEEEQNGSRKVSRQESTTGRVRTNSEREEGSESRQRSARGMDLLRQLFLVQRMAKKKRRRRRHTKSSCRSEDSESGSEDSSSESEDSEFENADDYLEQRPGGAGAAGRRSKRHSKKKYQFRHQKMKYLVPGDVIEIPANGCVMQCDIVLLSGNCIMDESMLTGECVPVTKTPLLKSGGSSAGGGGYVFSQKAHSRHILFAGTKLIQSRYIGGERVLGMVINVGIKTAKGDLIRSILYPPPVDYKFEQDSYKFIKLLGFVAFMGFIYTVFTKVSRGVSLVKLAVESLDLITIAVPPALPAAMSVGRMYAQRRLKKKDVYCISPRSINVSGSVDLVCFDKTGTLTEDGLDMWAVVPVEKEIISPQKSQISDERSASVSEAAASVQTQISFTPPVVNPKTLALDNPLLHCMVTCHSITKMEGVMRGDPLDLKMFESTGWIFQEPEHVADGQKYDLLFPNIVRPGPAIAGDANGFGAELHKNDAVTASMDLGLDLGSVPLQIGIIREFPFSSSLQRMSVITRRLDDTHFKIFAKGAPEKIYNLCDKKTVPEHFHTILNSYARQGYRIIALAYSTLPAKYTITKVQKVPRDTVERNLTFLGFCVMENRLKEDTMAVIKSLADAQIRTVMVTGDNILTAISVAKNCKMISNGGRVIQIDQQSVHSPSFQSPGDSEVTSQGNEFNELGSNSVFETDNSATASANPYRSLQFTVIDYEDQLENTTGNHVAFDGAAAHKADRSTCIAVDGTESLSDCHFAVDGNTYKVIMAEYPELSRVLLTRGTIFARMSPDLKQHLVGELQRADYYVAMCGDGANDCGALKIAHCGISLSDSEASVASPFTSKQSNISCVLDVIKEGRTALVTSFGIFKFMAAYSLIQFISVMILYSIDTNLTDIQFLYIDLVLISAFAFFFGKTKSSKKPLTKDIPENSLVSRSTIFSIFLQLLIMALLQATALIMVREQSWFKPFSELYVADTDGHVPIFQTRPYLLSFLNDANAEAYTTRLAMNNFTSAAFLDDALSMNNESSVAEPLLLQAKNVSSLRNGDSAAGQAIGDPMACYENFSVFLVSGFQYIILVIIFSRGAPYREPLRTNYGLLIAIVLNAAFMVCMVFYPPQFIVTIFQLMEPPRPPEHEGDQGVHFRLMLFAIVIANFVLSIFAEKVIVERGWLCAKKSRLDAYEAPSTKHVAVRYWDKLTFEPEPKKFQHYEHVIRAQVAPLIWSAVAVKQK